MVDFDLTYFLILIAACVGFGVFGTIVGCLLAGAERVIAAKMEGRVGPPLLQPFYDVKKLLVKEKASINTSERAYVAFGLILAIIAGGIFFSGGNLLMCIFVITLSALMIILAAYSSRSPYSEAGAAREILQVMSYEPMVLFFAVTLAVFAVTQGVDVAESMNVSTFMNLGVPAIAACWIAFVGLVYVLTIKLRKSPFDLSSSHHAHQELVSGMTTEMSGRTLALLEIAHWLETVLFLGWVALFFINSNPASIAVAVVVALVIWFLEIVIDSNAARVKWQLMLFSAWAVAFICGVANLFVLLVF